MTSSAKTGSTDFVKSNYENEFEFSKVVKDGRSILENEIEYQTEKWGWTCDLDDAEIFIFSYLLYDFKRKILSIQRFKESVYTLNLMRKKLISSCEKSRLSLLEEFQVVFTLYERLKHEEMTWEDCQEYVMKQISVHKSAN